MIHIKLNGSNGNDILIDLTGIDEIKASVGRIEAKLNQMEQNMAQQTDIGDVQQELQNLQQKVAAGTTLVQSTRDLIVGLRDQLHKNATDPAAIRAIADSLVAQQNEWAQSLVENTDQSAPMQTDETKAGQPADLSQQRRT